MAPAVPSSRNGGGDEAAALTSRTRAPVTSPAAAPSSGPNQKPSPKWRQPHDRHRPRRHTGSGKEAGRPAMAASDPGDVRGS